MNQVSSQYDVIIVDTAPASITADAQVTVSRCDGALVISRLNKTRLSDLKNIRDQLTSSGVPIVAAVVSEY
jgi:Mrp family chromosome partitioning ATPase